MLQCEDQFRSHEDAEITCERTRISTSANSGWFVLMYISYHFSGDIVLAFSHVYPAEESQSSPCVHKPYESKPHESLNRLISLGDNDHIDRPQFCPGRERVTSQRHYHRGCNMKRVLVDERPDITLFTFYSWGPRFVTRRSQSIQWFAQACAPKASGRYH